MTDHKTHYDIRVVRTPGNTRVQFLNVLGDIHAEFSPRGVAFRVFIDACNREGIELRGDVPVEALT